ncbi:hypothetical protein AGMMS49992_26630 [Clostridia bacterium]|nr:hypothetical protein AGMMS49992_26630 [Clostridia bacterium]
MIKAKDLANKAAEKVRTPAIPYVLGGRSNAGTDCINLVGWCVQELGGRNTDVPKGSNTAWRTVMQGTWTLQEAQRLGKLIPGALVYIKDAPTPQWPDGDFGHVGVYVGRQSGWAADQVIAHASASRGGVYPSTIKNAWNYVAWLRCVEYEAAVEADNDSVKEEIPSVVQPSSPGGSGTGLGLVKVTTSGGVLNIRQNAAMNGKKLGAIPNGALLEVTKTQGDWAYVSFGGVSGWVATQYLTQFNAGPSGNTCGACGLTRQEAEALVTTLTQALNR